jgi:hypothetical protein
MTSKCLPEYLLIRSQPSTSTGRGLRPESRGLVDTWVEGCISLIRLIQARDREFCRGCRHLFSNYYKEIERIRGKEKTYRDNNRAKYLHPLLPQPLRLAAMEGGLMEGGITARTLDYFGVLVAASVVALFSGVVATLCVKFEERGLAWFWAASFFGSARVAAYCLGKLL